MTAPRISDDQLAAKDAEIARLKADQSSYRAGCSCGGAAKVLTALEPFINFIEAYDDMRSGSPFLPDNLKASNSLTLGDYRKLSKAYAALTPSIPCACYRAGLERARLCDGATPGPAAEGGGDA